MITTKIILKTIFLNKTFLINIDNLHFNTNLNTVECVVV